MDLSATLVVLHASGNLLDEAAIVVGLGAMLWVISRLGESKPTDRDD